jgi:hypothetical protein
MRINVLFICAGLLSACLFAGCAAQSPETPSPPSSSSSETAQTPAAPIAQPAPATPAPTPITLPEATPTPTQTPVAATAPKTPVAPPAAVEKSNDPLADRAPGFDPSNPDRRCKIDSDCVVKDVGNCCGRFPMCVNKNAKTDPAAVSAQCAKQGMASICGFEEITACQCVDGQCKSAGNGAAVAM